jgi:hypothetical protein
MIVIFRNEHGTLSIRPALIGFIRNDYIRRTLSGLAFPLVLLITIGLNLLQVVFVTLILLYRAAWVPLSKCKPLWKTEIWKRPRTKADAAKTME